MQPQRDDDDDDDDETAPSRKLGSVARPQPSEQTEPERTEEEKLEDRMDRDWCSKDLDQSGDYNVTLQGVPSSLNGLPQCEDFPVGTKLPLHYRIEHDVALKRVKIENVDNANAIIRSIKTESHLLDYCKGRGHPAIVTAVDWTEYPIASKAYQARGYSWTLYLTISRVPTGQSMVLADAVLMDKYNHSMCHAAFDRDDH